MVIAQLINMLYNIVDRIYIGHIPGDGSLALTGVGVCMPIIMIVSAFAALVSSGGAPRASIYMGKQDNDSAENILGNCFSLQIIISVILTAILLIWGKDLLLTFGASENTISYAVDYMNIYAFGTLFVQLTLGMNAFITAQGFTTISMVSVLIGAVCNITLDPIFIFALHMGVKGAALATIISQAISTIWIVLFLCGKKTQLHLRKRYLSLAPKVILPCVALGLAAFIMQASESVGPVCSNFFPASLRRRYCSRSYDHSDQCYAVCHASASGNRTGITACFQLQLWSEKCRQSGENFPIFASDHLPVIFCTSLGFCTACSESICKRIFTADTSLIEFTAPMLKIYLGGLFLFGIQIACQMTFTSLGKAINSIIVAVVRKFVLLIPLIYIMPHMVSDPTTGVYMAEPIADIIAVLFTSVLFTVQFKKALAEIRD